MTAMAMYYYPKYDNIIFIFKNFNENLKKEVYIEKRMHLRLMIDLESYNWSQMIAMTMFDNHIISYISYQLFLLY